MKQSLFISKVFFTHKMRLFFIGSRAELDGDVVTVHHKNMRKNELDSSEDGDEDVNNKKEELEPKNIVSCAQVHASTGRVIFPHLTNSRLFFNLRENPEAFFNLVCGATSCIQRRDNMLPPALPLLTTLTIKRLVEYYLKDYEDTVSIASVNFVSTKNSELFRADFTDSTIRQFSVRHLLKMHLDYAFGSVECIYLKVLVNGGSRVERVLARFCVSTWNNWLDNRLVYTHPFAFNFCVGLPRNVDHDQNDLHEDGESERFEIVRVQNNRDLYSWCGGMYHDTNYYERETRSTCDLCLILACRHEYFLNQDYHADRFTCLRSNATLRTNKYALVWREGERIVVEDFFVCN